MGGWDAMAWQRLWYGEAEGFGRARLAGLAAAEGLFGIGVGARDWLYRRGLLHARKLERVTVISVGNLNVGGTGKTPAVIFLARQLRAHGLRVAVVSRGYGRASKVDRSFSGDAPLSASEVGDEPMLIARSCPGVTVWVGAQRARLAARARDEGGAQAILLDDGLQHRALARDLDIVTLDEASGLGNGRLLPRGPLREPPSALARAGLLWVRVAEGSAPVSLPPFTGPIVQVTYRPMDFRSPKGERQPLENLRGKRVIAVSGIARPVAFQRQLESLGVEVVRHLAFPDHHRFSESDLESVRREMARLEVPLVTTEKDQLRLPEALKSWALVMESRVIAGEAALDRTLRALFP